MYFDELSEIEKEFMKKFARLNATFYSFETEYKLGRMKIFEELAKKKGALLYKYENLS